MLVVLHVRSGAGSGAGSRAGSGAGSRAGSGVFLAGFAGGNHMLDGAFFCFGQHGRTVCWRWSMRNQKADKEERHNSSVRAVVVLATR